MTAKIIQRAYGVIGRQDELAMALAILQAGRHLLLEGPVGVGKTTVALAVCQFLGRNTIRIDGDERYTENKLAGWFDPALVMQTGYTPKAFLHGPLSQAMTEGAILFINELNRMPESVQNVLLPPLDEQTLILPQIGTIRAQPGFQVIATQNPVEYIATSHLSEALKDRFEHLLLPHQNSDEEGAIVSQATGCRNRQLIAEAVAITRATRTHPKFKKGASVRAAIAMVTIAQRLKGPEALRRAATAALATRVELRDESETDLPAVLDEIYDDVKKNG